MEIQQLILYFMAFGILLGGVDLLLGNRFGYGEPFRQAFLLLGPIALSMAGIICLAPLLSMVLGPIAAPLCQPFGMDPGILGSILAIDMGGYPLAAALAEDPAIGAYAGIIGASTFGCTLVFTIPVGLGTIPEQDRPLFIQGILYGLTALPGALIPGGLLAGLSLIQILRSAFPILLLSLALFWGIRRHPAGILRFFQKFAALIQSAAILGLTLAAFTHVSGLSLFSGMPPLMAAMETVCSIAILMLGSMPLAELLRRVMKKPFARIRQRTGLNAVSTTALLLGMVSVTPAIAMVPDMDDRGKVVCSAFLVSGASAFAAHLGYAMGVQPDFAAPMLAAKLLGGILGACIALIFTKRTT